jgi:hypothetical protein
VNSALVWFRRDLRDQDNAALSDALRVAEPVHCVFLFDTEILDPLPADDARVTIPQAIMPNTRSAGRAPSLAWTATLIGHTRLSAAPRERGTGS